VNATRNLVSISPFFIVKDLPASMPQGLMRNERHVRLVDAQDRL
jgi:hypothetical protein